MAQLINTKGRRGEVIRSGAQTVPYPQIRQFQHRSSFDNYRRIRRQAKEQAEGLISERERLEQTGKYTPAGVGERMAKAAGEALSIIGRLRSRVTDPGAAQLAEKRKALTEKALDYDPRDTRQELRDQEIRSALRAMGGSKGRQGPTAFLLGDDATDEIRAAVVSAPAFLSGVPEAIRERLREGLLRQRGGADLEALEEESKLNETTARALDVAERAAIENAGLSAEQLRETSPEVAA